MEWTHDIWVNLRWTFAKIVMMRNSCLGLGIDVVDDSRVSQELLCRVALILFSFSLFVEDLFDEWMNDM